jgi:hypothetical protein
LQKLLERKEFKVVRAKNRLSPSWDSRESAGYRDYQILVKTKGGFLVELQLVEKEMHALKERLEHKEYTGYRFLIEVGHRVREKAKKAAAAAAAAEEEEESSGGYVVVGELEV